jgi:hypothetical protein
MLKLRNPFYDDVDIESIKTTLSEEINERDTESKFILDDIIKPNIESLNVHYLLIDPDENIIIPPKVNDNIHGLLELHKYMKKLKSEGRIPEDSIITHVDLD